MKNDNANWKLTAIDISVQEDICPQCNTHAPFYFSGCFIVDSDEREVAFVACGLCECADKRSALLTIKLPNTKSAVFDVHMKAGTPVCTLTTPPTSLPALTPKQVMKSAYADQFIKCREFVLKAHPYIRPFLEGRKAFHNDATMWTLSHHRDERVEAGAKSRKMQLGSVNDGKIIAQYTAFLDGTPQMPEVQLRLAIPDKSDTKLTLVVRAVDHNYVPVSLGDYNERPADELTEAQILSDPRTFLFADLADFIAKADPVLLAHMRGKRLD